MKIFQKLAQGTSEGILNSAGKVIDNLVTTDKEKLDVKAKLSEIVLRHLTDLTASQSQVLSKELEGSKLQRSWRPIVMLSFAFVVLYHYFIQPLINYWYPVPEIQLPPQFWSLLEIGIGGYVIGRSVEKVADRVTSNIDMTFLKKRDRRKNKEEDNG